MNSAEKINVLMEIANKAIDEELKNKAYAKLYELVSYNDKPNKIPASKKLPNDGIEEYEQSHSVVDRPKEEMYIEYVEFCNCNDKDAVSKMTFAHRISKLGYVNTEVRVRGKGKIYVFRKAKQEI